MKIIIVLLLLIFALILLFRYLYHTFKFGVVNMINGGVKCGKTLLAVSESVLQHRLKLIGYYLKYGFLFITRQNKKISKLEKPLLYSNIPLNYKYYVPLTTEHIKREKRLNYKSITMLSEVSLVANSMNYKDDLLNEQIELFIKLYGHETRGGKMFIETQALGDNHYSIKRSIDRTCWIERLIKFIPFVLIFRVREQMVCDENTINTNSGDETENCKTIILFSKRKKYHLYDRYCYSVFTDNMPTDNNLNYAKEIKKEKKKDLKVKFLPTFRIFKTLKFRKENNDNEN